MVATHAARADPDQVAAALKGDPDALERVIKAWLPTVYAWCGRFGAGRIDAEEAAHDVMLTLQRRHHTVRGPTQLGAWLFGTTRRVVANHRRRAWWRKWVPGPVGERVAPERTDHPLEKRQLSERVGSLLDQLSEQHREVLVLCYFEERSVQEASALLGVAEGTIKSRLFNARKQFRALYEGES